MPRASFPAVDRVCLQCGGAWVQRDGQPPRDYCTTSCRNEAERQARAAQGEPAARLEPPARFYTRRVRAKEYTITCAWCQEVVTVEQYPGPAPRYCSPLCKTAAAREGAAERMRRMRARRQQVSPNVTQLEIS
jgi:hypothetical protein